MTNYRRRYIPGGTYFFSARLQDPGSDLLTARIDLLRHATGLCIKRWPFEIAEAVVLPSVTHMIWRLPDGDAAFSKRWRLIKSTFSRHCPAPDYVPPNQNRRNEKGIWQRRFWEHAIRDPDDYDRHVHVIATAPIVAGLARAPGEWPYSSTHRRRMDLDPSRSKTTVRVPSDPDQAIAVIAS
ncbi:transposase [Yoonia sp. SS1-5]|uniref:Transposase n=1 Tax=Yoonia rhodophyticola TaxID=3137370 RepID=A0AAN0M9A8_9RHOB